MSDIERAARALIEAWDSPESHDPDAAVEVLRSALAHAARGEGGPPPWHAPCVLCGHRQSAHNTDTGPCSKCGCDCAAFRPTPPPATGEECRWYTGNGEEYEILPPEEVRRRRIEAARRLRDVGPATGEAKCGWCGGQGYVEGSVNLRPYRIECVRCHPVATGPEIPMGGPVRIIATTPPTATGEAKWPEIRDSGGRTDFALTPATGEAGTREAEIRADERERCAKVCERASGAWHPNSEGAVAMRSCARAIRAIDPREARESRELEKALEALAAAAERFDADTANDGEWYSKIAAARVALHDAARRYATAKRALPEAHEGGGK